MSSNRLSPKQRVKIPRQRMPEQDAAARRGNFAEVNLGLEPAVAVTEATRCIECADPKCVKGCPVGVKVREFVELVVQGDFKSAAAKMREDNVLPAITGRVCPQEDQCEGACVMGRKFDPLAIGHLERFVADWEAASGELGLPPRAPATGKRVACVGSGPASLTVAGDLVQKGHEVTVFEALPEIGGVLVYGIPEFRLPKDIVRREIANMERMGVRFPEYDEPIYDCRGRKVAVVGGGNTALDAIRTAARLGAAKAMLLYRRSEAEMPGHAEEIHHARDEGVEIQTLTHPVEFLGDERGTLRAARCIRMALGEPDESGRRRPVPVEGSEFEVPLDVAIIAVGTGPNPLVQSTTPDLATSQKGYIAVADPETLRTSKKGVFAGGDIVTGAATVILAMGAGRKAARSIDEYLRTGAW